MSEGPDLGDVREQLERLAKVPVLLVACDYDGTIAPIVDDPKEARPDREVLVALKQLAAMPATHVAVISGRALADLAAISGAPVDVALVGSHGSEFDVGFARTLDADATARMDAVRGHLRELAGRDDAVLLEEKPASIAFHVRQVDDEGVADELVAAVLDGPGSLPGVHVKRGKKVVELSVIETDKGHALDRLRATVGASSALYIGDDVTDEDAFGRLRGPDVGIKVGAGETRAGWRVDTTRDVSRLLAFLAERRADWLAGAAAVPIEDHAMLSDQRTVALVSPAASVVWLCAPRIDSPPIFAELLGGPTAGFFSVAPADGSAPIAQTYSEDSLVLQTRWPEMWIVDYLDVSGGRPLQRAGRTDLVRVVRGRGEVELVFAPRLDFGRVGTRLLARPDGLSVEDAHDPVVLRSPGVRWRLEQEGVHHTARARVVMGDEPLVLELRYGTGNLDAGPVPEFQRRRQTIRAWSRWARELDVPGVAAADVRRSALVLKGLCHGPTGAIVAAGTTSLPETLGGVRNWDYRYCWLRDGAMAAEALVSLGSHSEAMAFLGWVLAVLDRSPGPERLRPLYSVTGSELGPEAEIAEMTGYARSRPVRVGNAAAQQVQLDVFGPIVSLVHALVLSGAPVSAEHWRLVEAMVQAVERRWDEPDHGIWEVRGPRRHYVHTKAMCWLAVDRAIAVARHFLGEERDAWADLRAHIAADVLARGWDERSGSFTSAYGDASVDAAVLQVGLAGLLPPGDPRFASTVERVERELLVGPTVHRYHFDDGLPGQEGGFQLCTAWLIESYLALGRRDDAQALFERYREFAGATGLMPEELDPHTGRALGNHPQAYSHVGLIRCARALSARARR